MLYSWDLPGGPVVKNLPSNAGDEGSIPGQGTKIPDATRQLSPCASVKILHATTKIWCSQINKEMIFFFKCCTP